MLKKSDYYQIGFIRKTHGVKGEMTLVCDLSYAYDAIDRWVFFNLEECLVPFEVDTFRSNTDKQALFSCKEILSVEDAEKYIGTEIFLPLADKPEIDEFETPEALIGYTIIDEASQKELGVVTGYIESKLNPLLEIEINKKSILLPFNEEFIVGLENQQLYVTLPDGILDL